MQLSFQLWTSQMQETLNSKKQGDAAFRAKDFATAIDCYSQVKHKILVLPLAYLYLDINLNVSVVHRRWDDGFSDGVWEAVRVLSDERHA